MTKTFKWCIFIILLLSFKGGCFAQSLEVDFFGEALYPELVPEREKVNDINGELCALIKVQIVDTCVTFEGGVSRSYPKGHNEWWVWISTEATHMTIKPTSYSPCTVVFGKYGFEQLENVSHQTYILRLVQSAPSNKKKTPRVSKLKPEKHTMEIGAICGTNIGLSMDLTTSYFLFGLGVDWMVFAPEQTGTSALANSGYTGSFSKTTTRVFSGSRTNVFINMGLYFKYFSISCQGGLLCGTKVNQTSSYEGWGYGLADGGLNEYWGSYEQRSFVNSTSDEELHFTLTPQIKGYIPIGKAKSISLSIGLGYTFIPSLDYCAGLSGDLGIHFRY